MNYRLKENEYFTTTYDSVEYICYLTYNQYFTLYGFFCQIHIDKIKHFLGIPYPAYFHIYTFFNGSNPCDADFFKEIGDSHWFDVDYIKNVIPKAIADYTLTQEIKIQQEVLIIKPKHLERI